MRPRNAAKKLPLASFLAVVLLALLREPCAPPTAAIASALPVNLFNLSKLLFFLHLALLLHGIFGALVIKARQSVGWELLPDSCLDFANRVWPDSAGMPYSIYKAGESELVAEPTKAYAVCGAQVAYSLWYLHSKHRAT